jgi:DNA-binding NtrC family response regulator
VAVIVTSAHSEETGAAAVGSGMYCFVRKPFTIDDLIQAIRESLSKHHGDRSKTAEFTA